MEKKPIISLIKNIKWEIQKNMATADTTLNANIVVATLDAYTLKEIAEVVVERVSDQFLEENADAIKRDILDNPKFADAVYNAIVLKKSAKELP